MTPKQAEVIRGIRKASRDGVAPSTARRDANNLSKKARRQGMTWAEACEIAGVVPYSQRSRDKDGHESLAKMEAEERSRRKAKKLLLKNHKCARCVWSRVVNENTIFCPMPPGGCMKHRKAGRVGYGTFKDQGGNQE